MQYSHRRYPNIIYPLLTKVFGLLALEDGQVLPGGATRVVSNSSFYPIPISDDKYIIIDAGSDRRAKKLKQFMSNRGLGIDSIEAIFLTHAHADHVGAIKVLAKRSGVRTYVSEHDSLVLNGTKPCEGFLPGLADKFGRRWSAAMPQANLEIIKDGQVVKIGNLSIRAINIPGHTKGSMGYMVSHGLSGPNVFYVGDALDFKSDGVSIQRPPRSFSADTDLSNLSIHATSKRVRDLGIDVAAVIPSHSGHGSINALHNFAKTVRG